MANFFAGIFIFAFLLCSHPSVASAMEISVQPFSGSLRVEKTDVMFDGSVTPFVFVRRFDGGSLLPGQPGNGWSHNFAYRAKVLGHKRQVEILSPETGVTAYTQVTEKQKGEEVFVNRYAAPGVMSYVEMDGSSPRLVFPDDSAYTFTPDGLLGTITDRNGNRYALRYENGELAEVSGTFDQWIRFAYDDKGLLSACTASSGTAISYEYDETGNLISASSPEGYLEQYEYDGQGRPVSVSVNGDTWRAEYDDAGRMKKFTDPYRYELSYAYGQAGDIREFMVTAPNGGVTAHRRHRDGSRYEVRTPEGGLTVTEFEPATGLPIKQTNPNGNATEYRYDAENRLTEVTDPAGGKTRLLYPKDGRKPSHITMPDGNNLKLAYDKAGNLVEVQSSLLGVQRMTYDNFGRLTAFESYGGEERSFLYGRNWLPYEVKQGKDTLLTVAYDDTGRPVTMGAPGLAEEIQPGAPDTSLLNMLFTFDKAEVPLKGADGLLDYAFDRMGNLQWVKYPTGSVFQYAFDRENRLSSVTVDGSILQSYRYDPAGNRIERTDAYGNKTAYTHDRLNRLVAAEYPEGGEAKYSYGKTGALESAYMLGVGKDYTWTRAGRLASSTLYFGKPGIFGKITGFFGNKRVSYDYDRHGRTEQVNGPDITVEYRYGQDGRPSAVLSKPFGEVRMSYAEDGRLAGIIYPNGVTATYRNGKGERGISIDGPSGALFSVKTSRDDEGRTVSRLAGAAREDYAYDGNGMLSEASVAESKFSYEHDAWGNRLSMAEGESGPVAYRYSEKGGLLSAGDKKYRWSPDGNLASVAGGEGETRFSYDHEKRLTAIDGPGGKVSFEYTPDGLLAARHEGDSSLYFIYDGVNPIADILAVKEEKKEKEEVLRRYLYAPGTDNLLGVVQKEKTVTVTDKGEKVKEEEKVYFFHRDERNNVVLVTDGEGNPTASYTYGPYGKLLDKEGNFESTLLFSSQRYEPAAGFYYMRNRFYDPETGRFVSPDPIPMNVNDGLGSNPYLYARANPMNFSDPLGLWPQWVDGMLGKDAAGDLGKEYKSGAQGSALGMVQNSAMVAGEIFGEKTSVTSMVPKDVKVPKAEKFFSNGKLVTMNASSSANTFQTVRVNMEVVDEIPTPRSANLLARAGDAFTVGTHIIDLADTNARVKAGMMSVNDGLNEVTATTVTAVGGTVSGALATVATVGGATVSWAALPVAATVAVVSPVVKTAVKEGMAAWDASKNADRLEKNAETDDNYRASVLAGKIHDALARGDTATAERLSDGLDRYAKNKRRKDNPFLGELAENTRRIVDEARRGASAPKAAEPAVAAKGEDTEKPSSGGTGEIVFMDEDEAEVSAVKQAIKSDKEAEKAASEQEIAARTDELEEQQKADQAALAEGLSTLAAGLGQVAAVHQQQQAQMAAQAKANREQVAKATSDYRKAYEQKQKEMNERYGDWKTQANPYQQAPASAYPSAGQPPSAYQPPAAVPPKPQPQPSYQPPPVSKPPVASQPQAKVQTGLPSKIRAAFERMKNRLLKVQKLAREGKMEEAAKLHERYQNESQSDMRLIDDWMKTVDASNASPEVRQFINRYQQWNKQ